MIRRRQPVARSGGRLGMPENNIWKILIIDDEQDIRDVLAVSLADAGYDVASAADGKSGLDLVETFAPHIVLTDIRMPRMTGLQVLAAIKASRPDIEVVTVTAYGEMELAIRALQLDASDFITKPISDDALTMALKRAKERYTSRRQLAEYTDLLEQENVATTQELLRSISFQRRLIDSSMDGILGCDREDVVVTFNRALERMLGRSRFGVIGRTKLGEYLSPEDERRLKSSLDGDRFGGPGKLFLYETQLLDADGQTVPVQVSATEILEDGSRDGLVFFFRDLRGIRKLEREMADQANILHQDKMMSLGRLAASVVHEINNPLSGILNYARLMKRVVGRGEPGPDQLAKFRRYLELVESETSRCSEIVSGLLAFSRRSQLEFAPVDIRDLVERSVRLSQHKLDLSNIQLEVVIHPDLPPVLGERNQLQQCLINLIFNAIDAMPDGGHLYLKAGLTPDQRELTISVRDTGVGIAPEDMKHIFEPFYTTKAEGYGVGLGLSTVYGIVEHHGGRVEMSSRPGEGATCTLRLPI